MTCWRTDPCRDQAERRPRRTRPGRATADGLASLSERELEAEVAVARLIVDRHTNKQIAAELFLGLKTVETRKLGVSSRVDVARAIERANRTP